MGYRYFQPLTFSWCLVFALAPLALAEVTPADVFTDHMVLQRGKPVPIWGTARAGENVTVSFAGQTKTATADKAGRWTVRLDSLTESAESHELTVKGSSGAVTLKDVLVGDVWIAGGQSNMSRKVSSSWMPKDQRMNYPQIRYLAVDCPGTKYPKPKLGDVDWKGAPWDPEWRLCTDETTPDLTAVGFFFAERVYKETGVPQGILWNSVSGSVAREWVPRFGWWLRPELEDTARMVDSWYPGTKIGREAQQKAVEEIGAWCRKAREAVKQGFPFPYPQPMLPEPDDSQGRGRGVTILYNGRVHPLVPYAISGILWWQGESDYANGRYRYEIEAMVKSWRMLFAAPGEKPSDLPFYFVQMQRSGTYMSPDVRDRQFQSYFTIPNAGMAVLIDIDASLHPWNKYDAGRRLALWALAKDYGKEVIYSGPSYTSHRVDGKSIIIEFDHVGRGLMVGKVEPGKPAVPVPGAAFGGVRIAGPDRRWHDAEAVIQGDTVVVTCDKVEKPVAVRYAWTSEPTNANLYNRAGFPALPFTIP